jgi:hypothetical protein
MSFDWMRMSTLDRVIVVGSLIAFIATFLPWYGVSVLGLSASVSGWSAGFSAWAGSLLLTAAGVLLLLRRSGTTLEIGEAGPALIIAIVAAVGLLLVVIRWVSLPRYRGVDAGARYGLYIGLIAGIAVVTAAVMQLRAEQPQPEPSAAPPAEAEGPPAEAGRAAAQAEEPTPPAEEPLAQAPEPPAQPAE